jgi:prefoldin subunit 5
MQRMRAWGRQLLAKGRRAVNDRSGLLTLAVYLTAAMLIVVAAFVGVFRYGAMARVAALEDVAQEPIPELAVGELQLAPDGATAAAGANALDQQRIRVLQGLLADKTERIREQAERLEQQAQELANWRRHYEEAMQTATSLLPMDTPQGEQPATGVESPSEPPLPDGAASADPGSLEAELMITQAVHDTLVSDLETLQNELAQLRARMAEVQAEADRQSANQLRDVLALETATAGVLMRIGREEAVPALMTALQHTDPIVRRWAATALGSFGPDAAEATGALAEALSDSDASVRRAVAAALDAIER